MINHTYLKTIINLARLATVFNNCVQERKKLIASDEVRCQTRGILHGCCYPFQTCRTYQTYPPPVLAKNGYRLALEPPGFTPFKSAGSEVASPTISLRPTISLDVSLDVKVIFSFTTALSIFLPHKL